MDIFPYLYKLSTHDAEQNKEVWKQKVAEGHAEPWHMIRKYVCINQSIFGKHLNYVKRNRVEEFVEWWYLGFLAAMRTEQNRVAYKLESNVRPSVQQLKLGQNWATGHHSDPKPGGKSAEHFT